MAVGRRRSVFGLNHEGDWAVVRSDVQFTERMFFWNIDRPRVIRSAKEYLSCMKPAEWKLHSVFVGSDLWELMDWIEQQK